MTIATDTNSAPLPIWVNEAHLEFVEEHLEDARQIAANPATWGAACAAFNSLRVAIVEYVVGGVPHDVVALTSVLGADRCLPEARETVRVFRLFLDAVGVRDVCKAFSPPPMSDADQTVEDAAYFRSLEVAQPESTDGKQREAMAREFMLARLDELDVALASSLLPAGDDGSKGGAS